MGVADAGPRGSDGAPPRGPWERETFGGGDWSPSGSGNSRRSVVLPPFPLPLPHRGEGMPVKICGLTRARDAALAVRWGASAVGVVFAPGPRRVDPAQAREILSVAPPEVARVGVFVNPEAGLVGEVVAACSLSWIQLSGEESHDDLLHLFEALPGIRPTAPSLPSRPSGAADARSNTRRVGLLKAIPMGLHRSLEGWAAFPADAFLLDRYNPRWGAGGTGKTFDWRLARELPWPRSRVALAGGLTPENLSEAVAEVGPALVDVSSGVEARPGVKDPQRLKRFLEVARRLPAPERSSPSSLSPDLTPEEKPR